MGALQGAPIVFEPADDVPMGGVLAALPALLAFGLLGRSRDHFTMPEGFYPMETVFLLLAFLALGRVGSLEAVRYHAPGEWGKLVGLDRIPEVKTLREKLRALSQDATRVREWSSLLGRDWMAGAPESAGVLYVDGHVRVYHGKEAKLPRRYVARERLCLRGTTDYWVNAMDGQPFFVVSQPVDPGLLAVLRQSIIPRLKEEVPGQPSAEELARDQRLHRFVLIHDREGYSPEFFAEMWQARIAVLTYHKFPGPAWPEAEFQSRAVRLIHGEETVLEMAERGLKLRNGFWVREVRHRDERGHQTSVLASDYRSDLSGIARAMFARWCQENFFKYMREHYSLDRLVEYGSEPIPDTTRVVNPAWRELDGQVRKEQGLLSRDQAQFGGLTLPENPAPKTVAEYEMKKGQLLQSIQTRQRELEQLKSRRKGTPKHVTIKDLPEADRYTQLAGSRKHLVDTIKLIAYRAETALVHIAREKLARPDDARSLARQLFASAVDLRPNPTEKTLTVRIHPLANGAHEAVLEHLCAELTATETVFPGTELRVIFQAIGASSIP